MKSIRLAFLLPALIAVAPAHAEQASVEKQPTLRAQHHRLEHMVRDFARKAEEKRLRESMLARR